MGDSYESPYIIYQMLLYAIDAYRINSITTTQSAGTYVGQVTSTNRNAYSDNGVTGSYWYVFVG